MLVAAWVLFALSVVAVTLRIYVRLQSRPRLFGNDDRFLVLALVLFLVQLAILTDVEHLTRNGTYFVPRQLKLVRIEAWLLHILYSQVIWSAKLSLFLLYKRLLSGLCMQKQLRMAAVLLFLTWLFVTVLLVIPLDGFSAGDPRNRIFTGPARIHDLLETYCIGPLDILTSVVLTFLPFALLRRLRINLKEKTALVVIFSLGLLCICAAILRWVVLLEISTASIFILWSTLEQSCLIIVQSLMVLRPLLYQIFELFGIDKPGQRSSMHQLSTKSITQQMQTITEFQASKKQPQPTRHPLEFSETIESTDTTHTLMQCLKLESPGPSLLCSILKSAGSEASTARQEHHLEMGHLGSKFDISERAWSPIQVEQNYPHSFAYMNRHEFMQSNHTDVFAGEKRCRQPRHPVKAKSLGALPRDRKDSRNPSDCPTSFPIFVTVDSHYDCCRD
ncbi:Predicted protein [Taphrina deformans PYCC 5710]|uniref:Rhodopsin domain-containing protein n=1 Tax=Taphrina deformans (strain PYCC 5710 / ATCC 11124 / CBS 356.35 / IMI 108563 / JCM 9778 / NBRC 8474) TaxID=1097556 RepID=R4XAA8_TAPDE|nr:Predicted protein [Taphrina deformans PYCC 5710]|eukprot:CCG82447.1 Predicted protein [Taphrina deformans PYCC 5710]